MNKAWIVVATPGRSGSSFVAEILHRVLNVRMGYEMSIGPDNTTGFFEDLNFEIAVESFDSIRITYQQLVRRTLPALLDATWGRSDLTGLKSPRCLQHLHVMLALANQRGIRTHIIRCKRPIEDQHKSWLKRSEIPSKIPRIYESFPGDTASDKIYEYLTFSEGLINNLNVGSVIDFSCQRESEDITSQLRDEIPSDMLDLADGPHPIIWAPVYSANYRCTVNIKNAVLQPPEEISMRMEWRP